RSVLRIQLLIDPGHHRREELVAGYVPPDLGQGLTVDGERRCPADVRVGEGRAARVEFGVAGNRGWRRVVVSRVAGGVLASVLLGDRPCGGEERIGDVRDPVPLAAL